MQVTLKDFQTTMKVAKGKEAASLPKKKAAVANSPFAQSSQDLESGFHTSERQALLQVQYIAHSIPCSCRLFHIAFGEGIYPAYMIKGLQAVDQDFQ